MGTGKFDTGGMGLCNGPASNLAVLKEYSYSGTSSNEVLDLTNNVLQAAQNYSEMHATEPRYNEFLVIRNKIWKPKRKIDRR